MTDVMFTFVYLGAKIVVGAYIPTRQNLAIFRALFVLPAVIAGLSYFVESSIQCSDSFCCLRDNNTRWLELPETRFVEEYGPWPLLISQSFKLAWCHKVGDVPALPARTKSHCTYI